MIPVPIGVVGEMYIGGAGLARGYLKRSNLTEKRFVSNPFATELDKVNGYTKLYRTGDFVRWLPDGNLEFIGRNDNMVKICGYRIELGEVEYVLTQVLGIKQCCVLAKEQKAEVGKNKYLIAYYVLGNSDDMLTQTAIFDRLSQLLPEYMIPSTLIAMESFPLTSNGKLDKKAFPDPDFSLLTEEYVGPITETEKEICKIWQEVLNLDKVGVTDNFFRIGGNNILAIQISDRMSRVLGCDVRVVDVFKFKSIKVLLSNIALPQVADENVNWTL